MAHLILQQGLDLRLVVVENPALKNPNKSVVQSFKQVIGPTYRWMKNLIQLSAEERAALKYEEQSIAKWNKKVDDYIDALGVKGRPKGVKYLETPSLREATVITAITKAEPDVCAVMGTSIIKPRLISIPKLGMINAHTSILPEYRGSRSEFWQCYNEDYRNVGVTLHFIDAGVDTGKILFQKKQEVGENPDPNELRANNTLATLQNYVPTIEAVLNGTIEPKVQKQGTTPTYRFKDITQEKRLKLYKRLVEANA